LLVLFALTFSTIAAVPDRARGEVADAPSLIADLGNRTLAILHETRPSSSRLGLFHALVVEKFDIPALAQFVAGGFWQGATDADRHRFTNAFEKHVTDLFSDRFSRYSNQTFSIVGHRAQGDGTAIVSSRIVEPNAAQGDQVDWRVAKTTSGFKITDVSVSGLSVAQTKRAEFGSILVHSGGSIAALAAALESRSARQAQSATKGN
jgi:phospholipid transport system substrate-binding protein